MNYPLVSIIVNCFNGERYLDKCLKSIQKQTYQKYEVIFWDNCSKDNSKSIFLRIKDRRFKYFSDNEYVNLYRARNKALNLVKGKYICFLDVDDMWFPEKLSRQVNEMEKDKNIGFTYSGFKILHEKQNKLTSAYKNRFFKSGFIKKNLLRNYNVGILTLMVRKSIIKKYDIKFDNKFTIMGDLDFVLKISKISKSLAIKTDLAIYRSHYENLSRNLELTIFERENWQKTMISKSLFKNKEMKYFERETKYLNFLNKLNKDQFYDSFNLLRKLRGIYFIKGLIFFLKNIMYICFKFKN